VQIGYFAQYEEPTPAEAQMDLVGYLSASLPRIGTQQLRNVLGAMLFSDDDAFKKFGVLSGGERARVRMCRLLLQNCNVLILDEPTNHLDMDSKDLLMRALHDFGGTVLFVSHDRYFVENIATRVILVKNGRVTDYPGDYQYYLDKLASEDRFSPVAEASAKGGAKGAPAGKGASSARKPDAKPAPSAAAHAESGAAGVSGGAWAGAAAAVAGMDAPAGAEPGTGPDAIPYSGTGAGAAGKPISANGAGPVSVSGAAAAGDGGISGGPQDWEARKEAEKRRRKAEKRWAEIEAEITGLDQRMATLDAELCLPETYADAALAQKLAREKQHVEAALASLYRELETLESEGHGR
jgi:ATP-binding cassette subfamily F protein 3